MGNLTNLEYLHINGTKIAELNVLALNKLCKIIICPKQIVTAAMRVELVRHIDL